MTNRVSYIDLAKCLGIFLMVLCHGVVTHQVDTWVHGFHMPLFFMLSGWCFSIKRHPDFLPFAKGRFQALMVPYFFWATVLFLGWQGVYALIQGEPIYSLKEFLGSVLYNNAMVSPYCAIQWFLTCMFFAGLFGWLVLTCTKEKVLPTLGFALLFGLVGWLMHLLPFRLPLSLDVAFSAACFLLIGWGLGKIQKTEILFHPALTLLYLLVGSWMILFNGYVNMRTLSFENPLFFYGGAITITLGILGSCYLICQRFSPKPLIWLGKNTLPILMLNQVLMQPLKQHIPTKNPWIWLGVSIGALGCMVPCVLFLNKFLPFSVGKRKKV